MRKLKAFKIRENPLIILENYNPGIDNKIEELQQTQIEYRTNKRAFIRNQEEIKIIESQINGQRPISKNKYDAIKDEVYNHCFVFVAILPFILLSVDYFLIPENTNKDLQALGFVLTFIALTIIAYFSMIKFKVAETKKYLKMSLIDIEQQQNQIEITLNQLSYDYSLLCRQLYSKGNFINIISIVEKNFTTEIQQIQEKISHYFKWQYPLNKYTISGHIDTDIHKNGDIIDVRYVDDIKKIIISQKSAIDLDAINLKTHTHLKKRTSNLYSKQDEKRMKEEWESF